MLRALQAKARQSPGVAPPILPIAEASAVAQPGPEVPFRLEGPGGPILPLEGEALAAPKRRPLGGVPEHLRQQAAVSFQPGGSPWTPAWMQPEPSTAFGGPGLTDPDPTQPHGSSWDPDPAQPPTQPPTLTGPTAPVPGLGPALQRSMVALEALRDQLAQILREDALRHGLNLKE